MAPKAKAVAGVKAAGADFPPADMLLDLCTRFILNCPEEEWQSSERIMFHVEQAHWYYEDFCRASSGGRSLRGFSLRDFAAVMFAQDPSLAQHKNNVDDIYKRFTDYKHTVPVFGAILLNPELDKCLMVRGWKSNSWGFPKGKVNKDEPEAECAAREVFEELGFDISPFLVDGDFVEARTDKQCTRLYIIPGISEQTGFAPQTRKEISEFAWHWISDLPGRGTLTPSSSKYYMVQPFVGPLRQWITQRMRGGNASRPQSFVAALVYADTASDVAADPVADAVQPQERAAKKPKAPPRPRSLPPETSSQGNAMLDFRLDRAAVMRAFRAKS